MSNRSTTLRWTRRALVAAAFTLLLLGLALQLLAQFEPEDLPAPAKPSALVFTNVSIVDLRDEAGHIIPKQWVVIVNGRIASLGAEGSHPLPADATVIDATGKYLMAGLWDAHIHTLRLSPQLHLPLLLAQGVTSVRDMGNTCSWSSDPGCRSPIPQWRERIEGGHMVGPRLLQSSSFHLEEIPLEPGALQTRIAALKLAGEPFLKLQLDGQTSTADFARVLAVAQAQGLPVAGHLPHALDLLQLPHQAISSIEHDWSLLPQCADDRPHFDGRNRSKAALLAGLNPQRCEAVLARLAEQGSLYVPTHIASTGQDARLAQGGDPEVAALADRYVPEPQRWLWALMRLAGKASPQEQAMLTQVHLAALKLTQQAHAAGVVVLAGTDALDADVLHGFSLHTELQHLVAAGLTPAQALAAATWRPAQAFGVGSQLGTVEVGKLADLLLLQANPLADIRNTRQIEAVVADGRIYGAQERAAAMAFVADQAQRWRVMSRFVAGLWMSF
ncbi:amidohydrolase family protein [Roseateles sp.]|uniref:amidohydrolase family protein n=1 Tax=Roseateles sp. TaxID=1971397 RepID=UPI003BA7B149